MKKKNRQIVTWAIIAILAIIAIIVLKNMDAFISGFISGGEIAE